MEFRGWQKTSLLEYPGKVSTVLFTGGCNFRCPFCYNRDIVLEPETLPRITEAEVIVFLKRRQKLYQAVIVTGGEPSMHKGLPGFYRKARKLGLLTGLETNGTDPEMLKLLLRERLLDFIAMDIKAPLKWEKYGKAAGIKDRKLFGNVRESVGIIRSSGIEYEFRTTVVPGIHERDDILEIAEQLKGSRKYVLQKFRPEDTTLNPEFSKIVSYPDSFLINLCGKIRKGFGHCELRNIQG